MIGLRIITILLAYLHTVSGLVIVAERRLRRILKGFIEALAIAAVTILLTTLTIGATL